MRETRPGCNALQQPQLLPQRWQQGAAKHIDEGRPLMCVFLRQWASWVREVRENEPELLSSECLVAFISPASVSFEAQTVKDVVYSIAVVQCPTREMLHMP